ncbi:MAG: hypothetical protein PHP95_15880 [Desulfuromonadaceae bacterium]|nr:hypothetical protein [Desulfuromonadaceae bacterium]MDD2849932.1 hypothetical protein [Desulfuromonadaceae bacterium]MDD4130877.1 hypothetical protein [Desulfuromonadaceae bacterium]
METGHHRFNYPETARAFMRNLANQTEGSEQMLELLDGCDKAQAALVYLFFKERQYYCVLQTYHLRGDLNQAESKVKLDNAWNEHRLASEEFRLTKEKLKNIIIKLDIADAGRIPTESGCNERLLQHASCSSLTNSVDSCWGELAACTAQVSSPNPTPYSTHSEAQISIPVDSIF